MELKHSCWFAIGLTVGSLLVGFRQSRLDIALKHQASSLEVSPASYDKKNKTRPDLQWEEGERILDPQLYGQWVAHNLSRMPLEARLKWLLSKSTSLDSKRLISACEAVGRTCSLKDIISAQADLAKRNELAATSFVRGALEQAAASDGLKAALWLNQTPADFRHNYSEFFYRQWAHGDAPIAWEFLGKQSQEGSSTLKAIVMSEWLLRDPSAALTTAPVESLLGMDQLNQKIGWAWREATEQQRNSLLEAIKGLPVTQFKDNVTIAEQIGGTMLGAAFSRFLADSMLAERTPDDAAALLASEQWNGGRLNYYGVLLAAAYDKSSLYGDQFLAKLSDPANKVLPSDVIDSLEVFSSKIASEGQLSHQIVEDMAQKLASAGATEVPEAVLSGYLKSLIDGASAEAVIPVLDMLPQTPSGERVREDALREWSNVNPENALNYVLSRIDDPFYEKNVPIGVASWMTVEPHTAWNWYVDNADQLPAGTAVNGFDKWIDADPIAASTALARAISLDQEIRDGLILALCLKIKGTDSEAANAWAQQIQNSTQQHAALSAIGR